MKIISVRFHNLNALKGTWYIPFEEGMLADAGLFAITGATGAGKTTILDAITVALYGQAPRHGKAVEELMTRHTGECWSEVVFECNGKQWRSKWMLNRARNKAAGALQVDRMELADAITGEIQGSHRKSDTQNAIVQAVGLDYTQFLRSVLLSQGEFTRFLKADPKERSLLLENMTDTAIYSKISLFVFDQFRNHQQALSVLDGQLENVSLLSENEMLALQSEKITLENEIKAAQKAETEARGHLQWFNDIKILHQQLTNASTQLEAFYKEKTEAIASLIALQKHLQAEPIYFHWQRIEAAKEQLTDSEKKITFIKSKHDSLVATNNTAKIKEGNAHSKYIDAVELQKKQAPLLDIVRLLDADITRLNEEKIVQNNLLLNQTNEWEKSKLATENVKAAFFAKEQAVADTNQWLLEHKTDSALEPTVLLASQMVYDIENQQEQLKINLKNQTTKNQEKDKEVAALRNLESRKTTLTEQLTTNIVVKAAAQNQLNLLAQKGSLQDWRQQIAYWPDVLSIAKKQTDLQIQATDFEQRMAKGNKLIVQTNDQLLDAGHQLHNITQQLESAHLLTEARRQLQTQAILLQKYEEDRNLLQQDLPCPLCGSTSHPFANNLPEQGNAALLLNESIAHENELREKEKSANDWDVTLRSNLQRYQQTLSDYEDSFQKLKQDFYDNNTLLPNALQFNEQESALILINEWKAKYKAANDNFDAYINAETLLTTANNNYKHTETELNLVKHSITNTNLQIDRLTVELDILTQEIEKLNQNISTLNADFQQILKPLHIIWQPTALRASLQEIMDRKNSYTLQYEHKVKLENEEIVLRNELTTAQQTAERLQIAFENQQITVLQFNEKIVETIEKRKNLLGNTVVATEKERLQQAIDTTQLHWEDCKNIVIGLDKDVASTLREMDVFETDYTDQQIKLDNLETVWQSTLLNNGFGDEASWKACILPKATATAYRQLSADLQERETSTTTTYNNVAEKLAATEAEQPTQLSEEEWNARLSDVIKSISNFNQQLGSIDNKIASDLAAKLTYSSLLEKRKNQSIDTHRWQMLSQLIGSADGSKFRVFAQGLTLERLINLANRHLHQFTERYHLKKIEGDSLEMEITDSWQADVARPISTLSGGETFLVSLALALGLSDLAGHKVQIQSLFIDEGFGTLDADTLDIAISALENLRGKGKTIGIISHVEALKERIGCQIQVVKKTGGFSGIKFS